MNCQVQTEKIYSVPVFAGNLRFFIGLIMMFVGLYVTLIADFQGHAIASLLVFASPFVIIKDEETQKRAPFERID